MFEQKREIVLASGSSIRRQMLEGAGLRFIVDPANIDERALDIVLASQPLAGRAKSLAEAKAQAVSYRHMQATIVGADQMLELGEIELHQAPNIEAARSALQRMRGRSHSLHSGVALAQQGQVVWSHVQSANLYVRDFSDQWLDNYMAQAGNALMTSVGAYQIEGPGVQLFDRIDGDYFTILGLPLLPLLAQLRQLDIIEG